MMETNHEKLSANTVGFCLLPSEIIQNILLHLALPEIICLKSVSRFVAGVISDQNFERAYNSQSRPSAWLFVYKKRWNRDAILHGFNDRSGRWFNFRVDGLLKPVICPGDQIYFLTASSNVFLFVSNTRRELLALDLGTKAVRTIPPSPLGPRGTSSWRRSGMKLVATGSGHFQFLFVDLVHSSPVLFVYSSKTDTWQSVEAREGLAEMPRVFQKEGGHVLLDAINGPYESTVTAVGLECGAYNNHAPIVLRPKFNPGHTDGLDRLQVFGDGNMLVVKSHGVDNAGVRMVSDIELWGGLRLNGSWQNWEVVSKVPRRIKEQIRKPYRAMRGCLERREGIIRAVLVSNYDGLWDIIWLSYDTGRSLWTWLPLPDCEMKGLNMAGIAFSSGLTLP
ncbi:GRAS FAMILY TRANSCRIPTION FACTOR FAMILY PROTEIN [Salix viminalis]|uniref:GRAS FAMILY TRANSCRIPTION FACTOR FAMILY PROTEIN n=1 Tax=Salix viminalis TaxID=40686 RepID=A0A9Q0NPV0_SALVM|nr:GRAS FAMILY TRANSCRIPTION FACTOR FAMILY PROTEIN [Salix viminalis]